MPEKKVKKPGIPPKRKKEKYEDEIVDYTKYYKNFYSIFCGYEVGSDLYDLG